MERLGLEKGTRKLVNHEERGRVLRAMDGCSYKAAAGGSLSNSLVALARLGGKPIGGPALNVAMAGSVGSDPLGGFYRLGIVLNMLNWFFFFKKNLITRACGKLLSVVRLWRFNFFLGKMLIRDSESLQFE